jgi:hypothetical protein
LSLNSPFTLVANETYNCTIKTGSYPQIRHTPALSTTNGWINCTEFTDANGRFYYDWIPTIRLYFSQCFLLYITYNFLLFKTLIYAYLFKFSIVDSYKSFEDNELVLKITESFYKGEEATENEVVHSLKHATIANLVGERAVKCALDNGFIEENNVIFVAGVPHAQIVKM